MHSDIHPSSGALPGIIIAASDYDRLVDLAGAAKGRAPEVAGYLERELDRAHVVPDEAFEPDVARVGSHVVYSDDQSGQQRAVTLSWPHNANLEDQRISVLTSIGAALLGLKPGQSIDWASPDGTPRTLTVVSVHNEGGLKR